MLFPSLRARCALAVALASPAFASAFFSVRAERKLVDAQGRQLPPVTLEMAIPLSGSLQHIHGRVTGLVNPQNYRVRSP
jgi:hypothetical protein